ncbi:hypothetical protein GJAV_G00002680 [Gymnothorax javanicus]|nr:hypothetical protein GJAV_G00002680 [Gymnothorax javanicus]
MILACYWQLQFSRNKQCGGGILKKSYHEGKEKSVWLPRTEEMKEPLLPVVAVILSAVLIPAVRSQDPVPVQFQTSPVLTASGTNAVLTVLTVPEVLSMTWNSPAGETLGLWVGGGSVINPVAQYIGRLSITATQLTIASTQLRDAGNYSVTVDPIATTGQGPNSRSVEVRVFDAVAGVRLAVPSVAIERGNITLRCTWTRGTEISVIWGKGGVAITPDSRVTISGGFLVINPARRGDAGEYSCTVSNLVSAQTATAKLTVFYGPDTPTLDRGPQADCVGGGQAVVGQTVRLTCESDSLPPALFSWQHNGVPVASGQPDSGVLSIQTFSTNQSGRYVCTARNAITGRTSEQETDVTIVSACLSPGAVAGIVIGCILALILIIVAIFLLVRWHKVDRRLQQATAYPKPDEDPRRRDPPLQPTLPQPRNQALPLVHRHQDDHQLQNLNTLHHNGYALPQGSFHGPNTLQNHHQGNANALQHSGQLNTIAYPPNNVANGDTFHQSGRQNGNAFSQSGQQNPNILIQTGQPHPNSLPATVHVNLNTLPNANQQPNTVHVNLNTFPNGGQPELHAIQNNNQHTDFTQQHSNPHNNRALPHTSDSNNRRPQHTELTQQLSNHQSLDNLGPFGHSDRTPLIQTGESHPTNRHQRGSHDPIRNGAQHPGDLVQTGHTHRVNRTPVSRRNADTQTYEPDANARAGRHDRSRTRDRSRDRRDQARSQMPWDRVRGTPAYPNHASQDDSDSYTEAVDSQPRGRAETSRPVPRRRPLDSAHDNGSRRPIASQTIERRSRSRDRDPVTPPPPYDQREALTSLPTQDRAAHPTALAAEGRDVQRPTGSRGIDRQATGQLYPASQAQRPAQNALQQAPQGLQAANVASRARTQPQNLGNQQQGVLQGPITQAPQARQPAVIGPGQTVQNQQAPPTAALNNQAPPTTAANPNNLTQAALQAHTARTHNPFQSRNQQTAAALRNPGTTQAPPQSRPQNSGPAPPTVPQVAAPDPARRPPTPPPVLPLAQFQTLPREHLPRPPHHPQQLPATQRPHPAHPNQHRHPQHTTARHGPSQGHHPTAHRHHGNAHPHPAAAGHRHPTNRRQHEAGGRARR